MRFQLNFGTSHPLPPYIEGGGKFPPPPESFRYQKSPVLVGLKKTSVSDLQYDHDYDDDDQGDFHPYGGGHVVVLHPHHGLLLHRKLGGYIYIYHYSTIRGEREFPFPSIPKNGSI